MLMLVIRASRARQYCDAELTLPKGKRRESAENITGRFGWDRCLARLSGQ
jgi:hypothetical protein